MSGVAVTFMSGPRDGETVTLQPAGDPPGLSFGRVPQGLGALCVPDDGEVSRLHARLSRSATGWLLEDLSSLNGTFLGEFGKGVRLTAPTSINVGDIFRVGLTRLRFAGCAPAGAALETGPGDRP